MDQDPDIARICVEVSDYVTSELLLAGVDTKKVYVNTFILEDRQQLLIRVFRKVGPRTVPDREITRCTINMEWVYEGPARGSSGAIVRQAVQGLLRGIQAIDPSLIEPGQPAWLDPIDWPPPPAAEQADIEVIRPVYEEALARQRARRSQPPSTARDGA